jgi:NhaP-type Na+/H+ or K+/H+ antiporter
MTWLGQGALADSTTWGLILGTVLPPLTAVVQQPRWTDNQRKIVAVLVAVLAGVLTCLANGALHDGQTVLATVAAVLVASQAAYRGLWKDSLAAAIERVTSPRPRRRPVKRKPRPAEPTAGDRTP